MLYVVLGAGKGLGRTLALSLAKRGGTLLLAGRRGEKLEQTASLVKQALPSAVVLVKTMDLLLPESQEQFVGHLASLNLPLRALVITAAGFSKDSFKAMPVDSVRDLVAANYTGIVSLISLIITTLLLNVPTDIISVTSLSAATTLETGRSSSLHIGTKAALQVFNTVVGRDVSQEGVRLTNLAPGTFARDERKGLSEEVLSKCIDFLLDLPRDAWIETLPIRPI